MVEKNKWQGILDYLAGRNVKNHKALVDLLKDQLPTEQVIPTNKSTATVPVLI